MNRQMRSQPGVMLQVFGQGVLLQGDSGVGKTDLALELVDRAHHLVADDAVEFVVEHDRLFGRCRASFDGFLEVHGLGLVSLTRLYGAQAVLEQAALDLVLRLENTVVDNYDRLQPVQQPWSL
ncbi:MAG TPA: HPr(Ser) kinase/phosphatase, partial [Candidatus Tenderia electrophaga]|nr:HPr(Ser) kinase/phosphatase [Candidatus Tenderia electrophaga]